MILRKRLVLSVAVLFASSTFVANAQTPTASAETLEQRVNALEKRLDALERIPAIAMALRLVGVQQGAAEAPSATPQANSPLAVVDWSYSFYDAQYDFDKAHVISYTLKNLTDKPIKLIQGSMVFKDLLGEKIMEIRLFPDVLYPPNESQSTKGTWKVNTLNPEEQRMQTVHHDDIKPELRIEKVVFGDNSIWSSDGSK
jgi:hypothetical protein